MLHTTYTYRDADTRTDSTYRNSTIQRAPHAPRNISTQNPKLAFQWCAPFVPPRFVRTPLVAFIYCLVSVVLPRSKCPPRVPY
jgi:hypothetical protein